MAVINKNVVYTAVFGGYDSLSAAPAGARGCDFVCFTDAGIPAPGWKIIRVKPVMPPALMNRRYKMFPHKYLSKYARSLYVDGNIRLKKSPASLFKKYLSKCGMAAPAHYARNSVYEEAKECVSLGKSGFKETALQAAAYDAAGFDIRNGLTENNILLRRHRDKKMIKAMNCWWREINTRTKRDQLSLGYAAWKSGLKIAVMKESARNSNSYFEFENHAAMARRSLPEKAANRLLSMLRRPVCGVYFRLFMKNAGMQKAAAAE